MRHSKITFKHIGNLTVSFLESYGKLSVMAFNSFGAIRKVPDYLPQVVEQFWESLLKQINNKQGSLGKLMNEDSLYENLNHTLQNLDSLIIDIKKNPSRYFEVKIL